MCCSTPQVQWAWKSPRTAPCCFEQQNPCRVLIRGPPQPNPGLPLPFPVVIRQQEWLGRTAEAPFPTKTSKGVSVPKAESCVPSYPNLPHNPLNPRARMDWFLHGMARGQHGTADISDNKNTPAAAVPIPSMVPQLQVCLLLSGFSCCISPQQAGKGAGRLVLLLS